jgi:CBS domain-containing protein
MSIRDLVQPASLVLSRSDSLEQAAVKMADPQTPLLPIVDPDNGALLGILTRRDVLNAYRSRVDI